MRIKRPQTRQAQDSAATNKGRQQQAQPQKRHASSSCRESPPKVSRKQLDALETAAGTSNKITKQLPKAQKLNAKPDTNSEIHKTVAESLASVSSSLISTETAEINTKSSPKDSSKSDNNETTSKVKKAPTKKEMAAKKPAQLKSTTDEHKPLSAPKDDRVSKELKNLDIQITGYNDQVATSSGDKVIKASISEIVKTKSRTSASQSMYGKASTSIGEKFLTKSDAKKTDESDLGCGQPNRSNAKSHKDEKKIDAKADTLTATKKNKPINKKKSADTSKVDATVETSDPQKTVETAVILCGRDSDGKNAKKTTKVDTSASKMKPIEKKKIIPVAASSAAKNKKTKKVAQTEKLENFEAIEVAAKVEDVIVLQTASVAQKRPATKSNSSKSPKIAKAKANKDPEQMNKVEDIEDAQSASYDDRKQTTAMTKSKTQATTKKSTTNKVTGKECEIPMNPVESNSIKISSLKESESIRIVSTDSSPMKPISETIIIDPVKDTKSKKNKTITKAPVIKKIVSTEVKSKLAKSKVATVKRKTVKELKAIALENAVKMVSTVEPLRLSHSESPNFSDLDINTSSPAPAIGSEVVLSTGSLADLQTKPKKCNKSHSIIKKMVEDILEGLEMSDDLSSVDKPTKVDTNAVGTVKEIVIDAKHSSEPIKLKEKVAVKVAKPKKIKTEVVVKDKISVKDIQTLIAPVLAQSIDMKVDIKKELQSDDEIKMLLKVEDVKAEESFPKDETKVLNTIQSTFQLDTAKNSTDKKNDSGQSSAKSSPKRKYVKKKCSGSDKCLKKGDTNNAQKFNANNDGDPDDTSDNDTYAKDIYDFHESGHSSEDTTLSYMQALKKDKKTNDQKTSTTTSKKKVTKNAKKVIVKKRPPEPKQKSSTKKNVKSSTKAPAKKTKPKFVEVSETDDTSDDSDNQVLARTIVRKVRDSSESTSNADSDSDTSVRTRVNNRRKSAVKNRRLKYFGFYSGPKRHRMASLNALAKVQCLYENESRTAQELGFVREPRVAPRVRATQPIESSSASASAKMAATVKGPLVEDIVVPVVGKYILKEVSKKEMSKEMCKKDVTKETGKKEVSKESNRKDVVKEVGKKDVTKDSSKKEMAKENNKKEVVNKKEVNKKEVNKKETNKLKDSEDDEDDDNTEEEILVSRTLRTDPGLRGPGKLWEMGNMSSMDSDTEPESDESYEEVSNSIDIFFF